MVQPTTISSRNYNIDAIRGLAMLGILFINVYAYAGIFEHYVASSFAPFSDRIIGLIKVSFIESRFISLFCMLFGVGLYIQLQKYDELESPLLKVKSRLIILMIFGIFHSVIIWYGDILLTYAIAGIFVMRYINNDQTSLLKWSKIFISVGLIGLFIISFIPTEPISHRGSELFAEQIGIFQSSIGNIILYQLFVTLTNIFTLHCVYSG
ncbi:DUF418 domain-containing protein [Shewanella marina]|uniref:DUF418 domain-containing protein n=1 Tax=Shewanella marina TaxID=487319 RepID=UPI000686A31F|nr:hypothetical protein [Shewanella marina]